MLSVVDKSDPGRVRSHNEDSTAVDLNHGIVIVADGMGGYRAGEVASAMAVTAMVRALRRAKQNRTLVAFGDRRSALARHLREAVDAANTLIFETSHAESAYAGMGTTVVSMLFDGNSVCVAHVGDSRAYRWRDGELQRLTLDHTVRQEMIDQGLYSEDQARVAINGNLVTRALGIEPDVRVDVSDWTAQSGDRFLLCSDGLTDMVDESTIAQICADQKEDLETVADSLVERAMDAGGEDNITVVVIDIPWRSRYQFWLRSLLSGQFGNRARHGKEDHRPTG